MGCGFGILRPHGAKELVVFARRRWRMGNVLESYRLMVLVH